MGETPAAGAAPVTACLIIIGNEILSGRTQDANLAFLGERLNSHGVRLAEARVIPDHAETIVATVNEVRRRFGYVFTTGGIGPTHDDITAECIARAFGLGFGANPEAVALLQQHYAPEDRTPARMRMANTPEGAELLENPVSKAPGFRVENVYVLPGVPRIMQAIFELLAPTLVGGVPVLSLTISSWVPEGVLGVPLAELQLAHPDVEIGSYPYMRQGRAGASLVLRTPDRELLEAAAKDVRAMIRSLGGEPLAESETEVGGARNATQ